MPLFRHAYFSVSFKISCNACKSKSGTYSSVALSSSCEKPFCNPASKNACVAWSYSSSVMRLDKIG